MLIQREVGEIERTIDMYSIDVCRFWWQVDQMGGQMGGWKMPERERSRGIFLWLHCPTKRALPAHTKRTPAPALQTLVFLACLCFHFPAVVARVLACKGHARVFLVAFLMASGGFCCPGLASLFSHRFADGCPD